MTDKEDILKTLGDVQSYFEAKKLNADPAAAKGFQIYVDKLGRAQEMLRGSVSRGVVDQIQWERDVAIEQLRQLGIGFAEKMDEEKLEKINNVLYAES